jgi:serine/threonine protein kinase
MLSDEYILNLQKDDILFLIYKATKKESQNIYTIISYLKNNITHIEKFERLKEKIVFLKDLNHPNIIKFIDFKENADSYNYIYEYYSDENMIDFILNYLKENNKPLSEKIVQYIMKQVVSAVKYLHDKKIVHRDIKIDNLFIRYNSEEDLLKKNILKSKIILGGFNFPTYLKKGNNLKNKIGTKFFVAPEIDSEICIYDEKVDIWSLGICCFALLYGKFPFYPKKYQNRMIYNLKTPLSKEASSFIDCMLEIDPKKRFSAFELSKHEFLTKKYEM